MLKLTTINLKGSVEWGCYKPLMLFWLERKYNPTPLLLITVSHPHNTLHHSTIYGSIVPPAPTTTALQGGKSFISASHSIFSIWGKLLLWNASGFTYHSWRTHCQIQIQDSRFLFVTYTIIQSITSSEMWVRSAPWTVQLYGIQTQRIYINIKKMK